MKIKQSNSQKSLDGDKAAQHILKALEGQPSTLRKGSILITCPYHSPEWPSKDYHRLSINLVPHYYKGHYVPVGFFRCWSCLKKGHFNDLINDPLLPEDRRLKVSPIPMAGGAEDSDLFTSSVRFSFDDDTVEEVETINEKLLSEWKGDWRGISEKVLRSMGALSYFDYNPKIRSKKTGMLLDIGGIERLFFYVYDFSGEKFGWIALADEKERERKGCLKQKNAKGQFASSTFLFHEKFKDGVPLVLVEGPFDALRLIQEGIPSVAMMGAGSWSDEKRDLLASKASHVIILFDGDETGYRDSEMIEESLADYVPTLRLRLPYIKIKNDLEKKKQLDPGNMPNEYVDILRNYIKSFTKE